MNEFYFYLIGDPPRGTAQQKGERVIAGRYIQHYDKDKIKSAKARYIYELKQFAPSVPWNCPVEVEIKFYFEKKSVKKDVRKLTRPDLDNSEKLLLDCMVKAGFFSDDSIICRKITEKWYTPSNMGRIYIRVKEIGND